MKPYTLKFSREDVITLGEAISESYEYMLSAEDDAYNDDLANLASLAQKVKDATGWETEAMQDLISNYGG